MPFLIFVAILLSSSFVLSGDSPVPILDLISSPEYEGRGVGTRGLEKAEAHIVDKLKKLGISPGIKIKDEAPNYTQSFSVFIGNELGVNTKFQSGELASTKESFMPFAFSRSGNITNADIVFVGFGISLRNAGEAIYDDYEGIDVQGKIVVAFLGDPATGAKDSVFRNPSYYHYSTPMYKVQNAEIHGAAGILLVRDPLSLTSGEVEAPLRFLSHQGGGASVSILSGQLSMSLTEKLLTNKTLLDLQKNIVSTQKPASFHLSKKASITIELSRQVGEVKNIAAVIPGNDPALAHEYIVIGAHYDHLGYGGDSSMDPNGVGKIHPGADDNASGVQGVFDLASRIFHENKNNRSVLFLFFSAEEIGLLGSKEFLAKLQLPEGAKITAMINLDMIGRLSENKLSVLAIKSAKEFPEIIDAVNEKFHFDLVKGNSGFGSSDHASFLQFKIPSLFFTTGAHPDYHRPSDTADKINIAGLKRIEDFVAAVFRKIDSLPHAPQYDPSSEDELSPPRQDRGYGVYFGSVPDFGEPTIPGVLLQGVKAGSPAERAGLRAGDILTNLGEVQIRSLYDLVFALRYYRPNDEVLIQWVREGKTMEAKTILLARE